jgi:hypothetical protein
VGDPVVEGGRRWRELWIHDDREELHVRYRDTIPPETARRVVALLGGGRFTFVLIRGPDKWAIRS